MRDAARTPNVRPATPQAERLAWRLAAEEEAEAKAAAEAKARAEAEARANAKAKAKAEGGDRDQAEKSDRWWATSKPALPPLAICSDAAARPWWDRAVLWRQRLAAAKNELDLLERYESAWRACELGDWQSERIFLSILQRSIRTPSGARLVLEHFRARPDVQKYLAKLLLRRVVSQELGDAIRVELFDDSVNWVELDLELEAIQCPRARVDKLRSVLAPIPEDPRGTIRLVRALVEAGQADAALLMSRRLRDEGLMTPALARELGDVLAGAGLEDESARTYSEIVEFDAENPESRQLLGDVYLAHGWYDRAYRQYATLTEGAPNDPLGWLRLAAAAAGAGRVDEALRLERRVASQLGSPGADDPRRWARLASAARLSRLLVTGAEGNKSPTVIPKDVLERKLNELQLFSGPGVLSLLAWHDPFADLSLVTSKDGVETQLGDTTDAAPVGLYAVLLTPTHAQSAAVKVRLRSLPETVALDFEHISIAWDGKRFKVDKLEGTLAPGASEASL